jgi:hypothetical protein
MEKNSTSAAVINGFSHHRASRALRDTLHILGVKPRMERLQLTPSID